MTATPPSALDIAGALIAFPSVTPADAGALAYVGKLLAGAGFAVEHVAFAEQGAPTIDNLWARFGKGGPNLVFAGHTDVVPPGDAAHWRFPPFSATIADGQIWGRGAADMKGGVAAALAAALRFVARGDFAGSISFLLTGDEEGPAVNGTVKLLEWARARGERFDHCLLGEPTSVATLGDTIKNGRRGSLTGRLTISGTQGHVAYPQLADNPIRALAPILAALQRPALDAGTGDFDPPTSKSSASMSATLPRTSFPPKCGSSSTRVSTIPGRPRRCAPRSSGASARPPARRTSRLPSIRPTPWRFSRRAALFTDLVARAIERTTGVKPKLSTSGGTSDARFIKDACPVIEIGLIGATMHAVDERVPVADIEGLSRIYERTFELYFAAGERGAAARVGKTS